MPATTGISACVHVAPASGENHATAGWAFAPPPGSLNSFPTATRRPSPMAPRSSTWANAHASGASPVLVSPSRVDSRVASDGPTELPAGTANAPGPPAATVTTPFPPDPSPVIVVQVAPPSSLSHDAHEY